MKQSIKQRAKDMATSSKRLVIGLVCDDSLDKTDGVQQYVLTLGAWLTTQGHEVHYITSTTHRDDIPNIHTLSKNIKVKFNGNILSMPLPARNKNIKRLLRGVQFDILHIQVPYSPFLAAKIIKFAPKHTAVIGTFHIFPHNWMVATGTRLLGLWLRRSIKRFDHMLSVSSVAQGFAEQTFHVVSNVVPNMVDVVRFSVSPPKRRKRVNVTFLGRLVARKGPLQLLNAVQYIDSYKLATRPYVVRLGGRGMLLAQLETFVEMHKLGHVVEFTGYQDELTKPQFLAEADIAVFPSTGGESFGISLIEAMAATPGPVLAGNNPGYRSVMGSHKQQLFDPGDTAAFATMLARYINSPTLRKSACTWQQSYVKRFDIDRVGAQVMRAYTQALRLRYK